MDQKTAVAALFDRVAATYDQVGVELFGPVAEQLVAAMEVTPGDTALDIGCGRGAVLLRLAERVGPGGAAHGVDLSPQMVEGALAAARDAGLTVDAWVDDAESPRGKLSSYDVITASLVLFFLPDPAAALRAWHGLLSDGGRLGVTTFGEHSETWEAVDAVFAPYLPPAMADARTTGRKGPFTSDEGVEGLLGAAGFRDVRTTHSTVPVRFDDEDHWHAWTMSVGQRRMWELVPEDERVAVRERANAALQSCRYPDGRLGFDQIVRFTFGRA